MARTIADLSDRNYALIFLVGLSYACLMQAAGMAVYVGEISLLIYFGFAAMFYNLLRGRHSMLILGLLFVILKTVGWSFSYGRRGSLTALQMRTGGGRRHLSAFDGPIVAGASFWQHCPNGLPISLSFLTGLPGSDSPGNWIRD